MDFHLVKALTENNTLQGSIQELEQQLEQLKITKSVCSIDVQLDLRRKARAVKRKMRKIRRRYV